MSNTYKEYLQSKEWQIRRQTTLAVFGGRCAICYDDGPLDIHHRSYKNFEQEAPIIDLIPLCRNCHDLFESDKKRWRLTSGVGQTARGLLSRRLVEVIANAKNRGWLLNGSGSVNDTGILPSEDGRHAAARVYYDLHFDLMNPETGHDYSVPTNAHS